MPVAVVRAAAAASTGLHYYDQAPAERERPGDPDRELLIASIDELTPEDRHDGARPARADGPPRPGPAPPPCAGNAPIVLADHDRLIVTRS